MSRRLKATVMTEVQRMGLSLLVAAARAKVDLPLNFTFLQRTLPLRARYMAELRTAAFHGQWHHDDGAAGRWTARLHEDWRLVVSDMVHKGRKCEVHVYHAAARATLAAFCPAARQWALDVLAESIAIADEAAKS